MAYNSIHFQWLQDTHLKFQTGVSLHGHTYYSRECLSFIPRYANAIPPLRYLVARQCDRYKRINGTELDFRKGWWTPPLSPAQAYNLETGQIGNLELRPIVSLSDHDSIEAPLELLTCNLDTPVSVEWSVPLHPSFIHLGIHNLPVMKAEWLHHQMQAYRVSKDAEFLRDVLVQLNAIHDVLVVFNHPLWDEPGVGDDAHREMAISFLQCHKDCVHALELNGLRPWAENKKVIQLGAVYGKPVISGGDRHDTEPNVCINLTNATTFGEFAVEVRGGFSDVMFLSSYCTPTGARITQTVVDVMREHPNHALGWKRWCDRVFYDTGNGAMSLSDCLQGNHPGVVRAFSTMAHLLKDQRLRPAVSYVFGGAQECRV